MSADRRVRPAVMGAVACVAAASLVLTSPVRALRAQTVSFSASTEAQWVIATVVDKDGHLVTDLTRDDLELFDNGQKRDLLLFRNDVIPFAVMVMIDVSGSMLNELPVVREGMRALVAEFQPGDRANIGTFNALPMVGPRFTANRPALIGAVNATINGAGVPCFGSWIGHFVRARGGSGIWDGVMCGIETVSFDTETPRRIVLVVTDGEDNASDTIPADVTRRADEFGVMVYAIGVQGSEGLNGPQLQSIAESTGGGYFHLRGTADLPATFARIADELRHQYVIGFSPAAGAGEHRIDLRVNRPDVVARWRRAYPETPPPVAAAPGATRSEVSAVTAPLSRSAARSTPAFAMLDRYRAGDWNVVGAAEQPPQAWRELFRSLRAAAPAWMLEGGEAEQPRRRLAVATFALELSRRPELDRQASASILEWGCRLLREAPMPSNQTAEIAWFRASVAAMEVVDSWDDSSLRSARGALLRSHTAHAAERVPSESMWPLARAIAADARTWPWDREEVRPITGASEIADAYRMAAETPELHAEAYLRWGLLDLRQGRAAEALARFDAAGPTTDRAVRYWLALARGRALEALDRIADAVAAYREAVAAVPGAQSAALALGGALVQDGKRAEAAALVTRALAFPAGVDPWAIIPFPDWRYWPDSIAFLHREIVR